jgi:predicted nucleic acid-binding protein
MIALLRAEPGGDVVDRVIRNGEHICFAHAINLCEVYYDVHRNAGEANAKQAVELLRRSGIWFRPDMDGDFWMDAGAIKSSVRRISLADCCALALARKLSAVLLTADHHELDRVSADYKIEFIR